mgnify:CR=1 FL=1
MEMAAAVRKCATFIEEKIGKHLDVTTLAGEICKELGKDLNHEFLDNETGYLAIHIEQIKCDEMVSE